MAESMLVLALKSMTYREPRIIPGLSPRARVINAPRLSVDYRMTTPWIRSVTICVAAFSLAAALVIGVFSQSHAAFGDAAQAGAAEPCPAHTALPAVTLLTDNCLALCDAADMDHLLGVLKDRQDAPTQVATRFTYEPPVPLPLRGRDTFGQVHVRGPPDIGIYLLTRRLRL